MSKATALSHARVDSPIGAIDLACTDARLVALEFADAGDRFSRSLARRFGSVDLRDACDPLGVASSLERYFAGDIDAVATIAADPGGTAFQREIWTALRLIPAGTTSSYGALASRLGRPRASRAVGHANGANPIALVIPCHRLVGGDGTLTGYAGGLARKRWLLAHEARWASARAHATQARDPAASG